LKQRLQCRHDARIIESSIRNQSPKETIMSQLTTRAVTVPARTTLFGNSRPAEVRHEVLEDGGHFAYFPTAEDAQAYVRTAEEGRLDQFSRA
jgi:hypothetical protein